ncbi:MAG TPA: VanZ family protein [Opitutaceae bacterium]|nr:VanZ family protein [Opitutaceae bacterium]
MLVWMGVVFMMSTDTFSAQHTGSVLLPLLHWLDPNLSPMAVDRVQFLIRKSGHVTEYGVLALLILRGLRMARQVPAPHWSWSLAATALCGSAAYGATDEIHQLFVPSRGPAAHDVLVDASGAAFALLLAFAVTRARRPASAAVQAGGASRPSPAADDR